MIADLLRVLEDVRRQEDGLAAAVRVDDRRAQDLLVDRVEARERLVEHEELRIVQHRRDELHLLLHALRERLHAAVAPAAERHALEPVGGAAACLGRGDALEPREEDDAIEHAHLLVEAPLLRQVADAFEHAAIEARVLVEQEHPPRVAPEDAERDAQRGRLAGAVRTEQPIDGAGRHRERERLDRDVSRIALGRPSICTASPVIAVPSSIRPSRWRAPASVRAR